MLCALAVVAGPAGAAVLEVGPTGGYATIQDAIDATSGASDEIRVAAGRFVGQVDISTVAGVALELSGGWAPDFGAPGFGETIIDAGGSAPAVRIGGNGGQVRMRDFTVTGATRSAPGFGGGVLVNLSGDARVELISNVIIDNALSAPVVDGVGLLAWVRNDSKLVVRGSTFKGNNGAASGAGGVVTGVGASVHASHRSAIQISDNDFLENEGTAPFISRGVALWIEALEQATVEVDENEIRANKASSSSDHASVVWLSAGYEQTEPPA